MRYELNDCEWSVIKPMLPNKPRGIPAWTIGRPQWHLLGRGVLDLRTTWVKRCARARLPMPRYSEAQWRCAEPQLWPSGANW